MRAMDILDPVGSTTATARALRARPASLQGAIIGVLDNSKPNARVLLDRVARALAEKVGAREVRVWRKPGASIGAVLRAQSDLMRVERFQRAEKAGARASSMVLLPLVIFILPAALLVIVGPVLLRFVYGMG